MSNDRNRRTLDFDLADAPMIAHALMIGANTAMMCGNPGAQARLKQYLKIVRAFCPEGMDLFDEEDFAELGAALSTASVVHVWWDVPRSDRPGPGRVGRTWASHGPICVDISGERWETRRGQHPKDGPQAEIVRKLLADLAPMDCEVLVGRPEPEEV